MKIAFTLRAIRKQLGFSALLLCIGMNSQAQSALVAGWHFNAYNNETSIPADYGSGTIYLDGTEGSSAWTGLDHFGGINLNTDLFPTPAPPAGTTLSLIGNSSNGKSIVVKFSMTGYSNLDVSFATRGTATGFNAGTWDYSTDGITWTAILANTATTSTTFSVKSLPTITALNNVPTAYLRYTLNGATSASGNNRIDNLALVAGSGPLAITLGNITAANKGKENLISWNSLTEDKGDRFVLEHSSNGSDFRQIYQVDAKGIAGKYNYNDRQPNEGINYYRLYLINNDGARTYSKTVTADVKGNSFAMSAYPNPAIDKLTVKVSGAAAESQLALLDINGRVIGVRQLSTAVNGLIDIDTKGLQPGFYVLRLDDGQNVQTLKISKQ